MNFEILIPITLFLCVTYAIKAVVDARTRKQMIATNGSQDLVRSTSQAQSDGSPCRYNNCPADSSRRVLN